MKASQPILIETDCVEIVLDQGHPRRSVLSSNFNKQKSSIMTKPVSLIVGSGLGLPVKSENGLINISSVSCTARPRMLGTEEISLGRKRRLEHLSFEEKLKRKKLKNRVAAQTSRDRKKARMDELEAENKELQEKNKLLVKANLNLQIENEKLVVENQELRVNLLRPESASQKQAVGVGCSPLIIGPAASVVYPLPKGRGLHPASGLCDERALWKILTFCILSQISLQTTENQTSLSTSLKNLQQVCFEKLMKTNKNFLYMGMTRLLADVENDSVPMKWWGRHQKTWNPVDV